MSRAAFLDRDGVLNELVWFEEAGIVDSPFHENQVRLIPGAAEAVRRFREAGYQVVVVSNQPAVAKEHCSRERLDRMEQAGVDRVTFPVPAVERDIVIQFLDRYAEAVH